MLFTKASLQSTWSFDLELWHTSRFTSTHTYPLQSRPNLWVSLLCPRLHHASLDVSWGSIVQRPNSVDMLASVFIKLGYNANPYKRVSMSSPC
jgi:hypothetical protein